tara:strand:+ start:511 stop:753 length:243 start_codon:yes stop_codon:yes gene_type:complete
MDTSKFKTEAEKEHDRKVSAIILNHCVSCRHQLDLLQLRLIEFEDLIKGVTQTIRGTSKQLQELTSPTPQKSKVKKLKKV